jgi:hypothetical protein
MAYIRCRAKGTNSFQEKMMKKIMSSVLATILSASFVGAAALPANAASIYVPQATTARSDVVPVVDTYIIRRDRHYRRDRRNWRRHHSPRVRYWRGHRGYDHSRPGYRRHGDFWFPLAAFATGAIISGAIANSNRPVYAGGDAHVRWCYERYRSYRASDNTFQPYNGPRRQCISPY